MRSPDLDEGSSCVSRCNMIFGGASVVAAMRRYRLGKSMSLM